MTELIDRIADAIQRQHDLNAELTQLSKEFQQSINYLEDMTARLQARYTRETGNIVNLPKIEEELSGFQIPAGIKPVGRK